MQFGLSPLERLFRYCPSVPRSPSSNWDQCASDLKHQTYAEECRVCFPQYIEQPVRWQFGDNISRMPCPTVVKSRVIGDLNAVLLPLNAARHWGRVPRGVRQPLLWTPASIEAVDIPFSSKTKRIVWRGGTTGNSVGFDTHPRTLLVQRWARHAPRDIDVGYHEEVQGKTMPRHLMKAGMSIRDQLRSAFVVAVEGNDVASNLKWILWSNSVPIMPPPRYESWLLEGCLRPMVHYVPCDPSMADLDRVLKWCRSNPKKCAAIAAQGKAYIAPFFNEASEREMASRVLDRYLGMPTPDADPPARVPRPSLRVRSRRRR